jgi:hypothetical protein
MLARFEAPPANKSSLASNAGAPKTTWQAPKLATASKSTVHAEVRRPPSPPKSIDLAPERTLRVAELASKFSNPQDKKSPQPATKPVVPPTQAPRPKEASEAAVLRSDVKTIEQSPSQPVLSFEARKKVFEQRSEVKAFLTDSAKLRTGPAPLTGSPSHVSHLGTASQPRLPVSPQPHAENFQQDQPKPLALRGVFAQTPKEEAKAASVEPKTNLLASPADHKSEGPKPGLVRALHQAPPAILKKSDVAPPVPVQSKRVGFDLEHKAKTKAEVGFIHGLDAGSKASSSLDRAPVDGSAVKTEVRSQGGLEEAKSSDYKTNFANVGQASPPKASLQLDAVRMPTQPEVRTAERSKPMPIQAASGDSVKSKAAMLQLKLGAPPSSNVVRRDSPAMSLIEENKPVRPLVRRKEITQVF